MKEIFTKCDTCKGNGFVPDMSDINTTAGDVFSCICPKCGGRQYVGTGFFIEESDQTFLTVGTIDLASLIPHKE